MTATPTPAPAPRRTPSRGRLGPVVTLARRRSWRDRWIVLAATLVVALAAFLAYAGPQMILGTLDDGAADAVRSRADGATIEFRFPVGNTTGNNVDSVRGLPPEAFAATVDTLTGTLPHDTASVVSTVNAAAVSTPYALMDVTPQHERDVAAADHRDAVATTRTGVDVIVAVVPGATSTVIDGVAPVFDASQAASSTGPGTAATPQDNQPSPLQVALTQPTLDALGLAVGDQVTLGRANGGRIQLIITAVVAIDDPHDDAARLVPGLVTPQTRVGGTGEDRTVGTVLLPPQAAAAFSSRVVTPLVGHVLMGVDPAALTLELARSVPRELEDLEARSDRLLADTGITARISTGLGDALKDYPVRARAALAQMSVLIAGVTATAAAVIALMAHLLIRGRRRDIELERARGASVASSVGTLVVESAAFTVVGLGLGYGTSVLVTPGAHLLDPLALLVGVVALCATPVLGAVVARASWAHKREPANRRDRDRVARARSARSLTRDALVLVVTAVAVWSLRGRGVLQTQTVGVDPFLAIAPALVALAVALIVVRAAVGPRHIVQAITRHSRGAAGLLISARARERIAALPLVALALALAVSAYGALLASTVERGQESASWERIGGDARIEAPIDAATVTTWQHQGLTVSRLSTLNRATIALGSSLGSATFLGIDPSYGDLDPTLTDAERASLEALNRAASQWHVGDPIPALASPSIRELDVYGRSDVFVGRTYLPVDFIADAAAPPDGWMSGPYVMVALEPLLASATQDPVETNITIVTGPGTDAAIAAAGIDASTVSLRSTWLDTAHQSALMGGVQRTMTWAVLAASALAAVGLMVSVATGARDRGRAVALLRTQGVPASYGWWLAVADLIPVVLSSAVAAAIAAVAVMLALSAALGLVVLAGGISDPPPSIDAAHLAPGAAALAGLVVLAVIGEVLVQRRARLSEVLRYGETR